jgi:hypothetical protein
MLTDPIDVSTEDDFCRIKGFVSAFTPTTIIPSEFSTEGMFQRDRSDLEINTTRLLTTKDKGQRYAY